jgi:hypothetical protein
MISVMVFCSRNAHDRNVLVRRPQLDQQGCHSRESGTSEHRRMGRAAWPSSCSWNAHNRKVLVRRAHSRVDQATR